MDRSLYPEGVEVHQDDLERTETTKKFHIIQRQSDSASLGVVSGFDVTVNTINTSLIDIAAGTGYAPNGEFVELTSLQSNISLSDYTLSSKNYILAIYTETNDELEPHETNGNSFPTASNRSVRIRVLNQSEFNALPLTDENLSNDAIDRALLLAIVTAQGPGVNLSSSSIQSPTEFPSAVSATNSTNNIAGITILSVDRTTPSGNGTLQYTQTGTLLEWTAPGDVGSGGGVNVGISGTYSIPSSSGKTLTIISSSGQLGVDNTDTIIVSNIYTQIVNRYSTEDLQHRSLLGSGIPTIVNPHGLSIIDILGEKIDEIHQDLFHSNGILRTSNVECLNATGIDTTGSPLSNSGVDTSTAPDQLKIFPPISGDAFYLNGIQHNAISNTIVTFTGLGSIQAIFDIYAVEGTNGVSSIQKFERARYTTTPPPGLSDLVQLKNVNRELGSGTAQLRWNDTSNILAFKAPGDSVFGTAVVVALSTGEQTYRLVNTTGDHYLDVHVDTDNIDGFTTIDENITIQSLPDQENKLLIATVMFDVAVDGSLGNGFGAGQAPNTVTNQRLFGNLAPGDLRDDVGDWIRTVDTNPNESFANTTLKKVGIGTKYPDSTSHLNVVADSTTNNKAIVAKGAGTGPGITTTGGNTSGAGMSAIGGSPNGVGLLVSGTGTGYGISATGGPSNGVGIEALGKGAETGIDSTGGDSSGPGIRANGGSPNGFGIIAFGKGAGSGVRGTNDSNGSGVYGFVAGTGPGVHAQNTVGTGPGLLIQTVATGGNRGQFRVVGHTNTPLAPSVNDVWVGDVSNIGIYDGVSGDNEEARPTFGMFSQLKHADINFEEISNTTIETAYPLKTRYTLPALRLYQRSVLEIFVATRPDAAASGTFITRIKAGPTVLANSGAVAMSVLNRCYMHYIGTVKGTLNISGLTTLKTGLISGMTLSATESSVAISSVNGQSLHVTIEMSVANVNNQVALDQFIVRISDGTLIV